MLPVVCGKVLCSGCIWASVFAKGKGALKKCCAFCREPSDSPIEEETRKCKKRMEAGDAETFYQQGIAYETGDRVVPRDKNKALEMWNRAADLGHADAHHHIVMIRQAIISSVLLLGDTKWQGTVLA